MMGCESEPGLVLWWREGHECVMRFDNGEEFRGIQGAWRNHETGKHVGSIEPIDLDAPWMRIIWGSEEAKERKDR